MSSRRTVMASVMIADSNGSGKVRYHTKLVEIVSRGSGHVMLFVNGSSNSTQLERTITIDVPNAWSYARRLPS